MLSAGELAEYAERGYLVCPDLLSREACDAACARLSVIIEEVAAEYAAGARPVVDFWSLMARSRDGIEVFWDPSRGPPAPGSLEGATMRVGHAIHRLDPVFRDLAATPALREGLRQIVGEPGELIQSAVIYKQPRSRLVQFGMHQDAWYLTTEPDSLVLAFLALDDMRPDNGCLEVLPGSHRGGLGAVLKMGPNGFVPASGRSPREPSRAGAVALPIPKGAVVFADGRTYHGSGENRSDGPRRALILHAKSARARLAESCWILEDGAPTPSVPL